MAVFMVCASGYSRTDNFGRRKRPLCSIGYQLPDGSYLENTQLEPDIKVANAPETVVQGEDTQLKVAVDELLKEIDGK